MSSEVFSRGHLFLYDCLSQTSFSLYLYNQWTDFHKLSCAVKPQMRTIHICVGCTKATTNNWDIRSSVTVKALFANILWMAGQICTIEIQTYQCSNIIRYLLKLAWQLLWQMTAPIRYEFWSYNGNSLCMDHYSFVYILLCLRIKP